MRKAVTCRMQYAIAMHTSAVPLSSMSNADSRSEQVFAFGMMPSPVVVCVPSCCHLHRRPHSHPRRLLFGYFLAIDPRSRQSPPMWRRPCSLWCAFGGRCVAESCNRARRFVWPASTSATRLLHDPLHICRLHVGFWREKEKNGTLNTIVYKHTDRALIFRECNYGENAACAPIMPEMLSEAMRSPAGEQEKKKPCLGFGIELSQYELLFLRIEWKKAKINKNSVFSPAKPELH